VTTEVQPFGVKASEAIAFLKGKLPEASLAWDDLAGPVHAKVFTVAGASTTAIASELHQAMVSAIDNGTTITDFRKSFDSTVAKHGWTYNGSRGWRTQIIFDANMRSAHMAGRWSQLWAGRERRPFLEYRTAGDSRVRPQHRQWNGIIRAITDAFWATFYPPNGWGCRCTVRARTQAEIDAKGLTVETSPFESIMRTVTKAGEPTDLVPVGVDPGWDHNVGVSWISPEIALGRKLLSLPPSLRDAMVAKTISPAFQKALKAGWNVFQKGFAGASAPPAAAAQIVGYLDGPTINGLQGQLPDAKIGSTAVAVTGEGMASLTWPAELLDDLPIHLRNYSAVLWDAEAKSLVVVPADTSKAGRIKGRAKHTIRVAPATTGPARGAMAVTATGITTDADLAKFTVLSGRLD
jgi:SPP1 gp7 family putative phage head morphogenesis protein